MTPRLRTALSRGVARALSLAPATLLLALARGVEAVAGVAAFGSLVGAGAGGIGPAIALVLTASFIASLTRALAMAGAMLQGKAHLDGKPVPMFAEAVAAGARRGFSYFALSFLIHLLVRSWIFLAFATATSAYVWSLFAHRLGFVTAFALAIPLTVSAPLFVWATVVTELAFVRSVSHDESYTLAVHDAAKQGVARAFALILIFGVVGVALTIPLSMVPNLFTSAEPSSLPLAFGAQAVSALWVACVAALVDHSLMQALLFLDLGSEPAPLRTEIPVAPVVPVAQVIPVAPIVGGGSG